MKHLHLFTLSSCLLLAVTTLTAQEKKQAWSLEDCLQYAYEQNIELKQSRLSLESSKIDTKNAKSKLFPSLTAGVSYQYTNTPFVQTANGSDDMLDIYAQTGNTSSDKNQISGSYNLRSSLTLFNGGKMLNQIKSQQVAEEMQSASLEETFDNIESAIISGYLQILYAQEAILINQQTVEVSKAQCERGEKLKNAGTLSESDYAQLVSQYSSDKYQLVVSQNTLAQNQLTLKQLLELGIDENIEVVTPTLDDTDVLMPLATQNEIYQMALAYMPTIKYSELNITASKLELRNAKSGFSPSLSFSAGVSTGHFSTSSTNTRSQMKNKLSESLGLSLSIPIYSNRDTRSAVSKARIAMTTAELELENTKKNLLSEIENLYLEVKAAQEQYISAQEQVKATEASYALIQEKFNQGMANTLELLTEKNNLLIAEQKALQAKYMAILNRLLLNVYQNKPISL
ncbi:MAG: TolC family protein [Porphyromonadaceae bacterium]|nr:TolC family protein [Porphyromonadaceae bacterium]